MKAKPQKFEIVDGKVKVFLPKGNWVIYPTTGWTINDRYKFVGDRLAINGLRAVIEKVVDWRILDEGGIPIPFKKEEILRHIDIVRDEGKFVESVDVQETDEEGEAQTVTKQVRFSLPPIPSYLEVPLTISFITAKNAADDLPLEKESSAF